MLYRLRNLLACLALVSLTKAIITSASRREALLSALPGSVVGHLSGVVEKLTEDQVSVFYAAFCGGSKCNGATVAFLLDYCGRLAPEGTPEESDAGGKWATCARYGDSWLLEHVQRHFPELPGDFTHTPYGMDKTVMLDALGEWHRFVNYFTTGSNMGLDKALLFVLVTDPVHSVERKSIKAKILCYLARVKSGILLNYWIEQSESVISEAFYNAMRGKDRILPIIQPELFKDCNRTHQNYLTNEWLDLMSEPLFKYLQEIGVDKLVDVMKKLKGPRVHDLKYEQSVGIYYAHKAIFGEDFHGEPPERARDDYLIMEPTRDSWDEFDRQLPVVDPKSVAQLFASSPDRVRKLELEIREKTRGKSLTAIDEAIKSEKKFYASFSVLRHEPYWVLHNIVTKYPEWEGFFYAVKYKDRITIQELEEFLAGLQGVRDIMVMKLKIDQFATTIARQYFPNHLLFKEEFEGALKSVQDRLYRFMTWNDTEDLDSIITNIDAQADQVALGQLQAVVTGSKIHQAVPCELRYRLTSEPKLDNYESRQLRQLWRCSGLWPLAYHPEMPLHEFLDKDEIPNLAQILLHFYEQHHQKIPDRKTHFGKILNGIAKRTPRSWGDNTWGGAKIIRHLGSDFDFSTNPGERWKKFEEELYEADCDWERFRQVRDSTLNIQLSEKNVKPRDYTNYTELFNAMVEAAKDRLSDDNDDRQED